MGRVPFIGVEHRQRGHGLFRGGIEFDGGLEFAFCLLKIVVQAVEAAEQQVIVDAVGIELRNLLVLVDGQLQNIVGAGTAGHVSEGAQINAAEKLVGFEILGIALDDVLRFLNSVGDAAGLYVELSQGGSQELRRGVGFDGEAVFFGGLGGEVAAAVSRDHLFIHVRHRVMVVSSGLVDFARRRLGRLSVGRGGFRLRRAGLGGRGYRGRDREHQKRTKNSIHAGPDALEARFRNLS